MNNQQNRDKPTLILVMGVSGSGKTTLAQELAKHYQFKFLDADDFHSESAKAMMAANQAITTDMRQQWIDYMSKNLMKRANQQQNIVLAYSGLVAKQRQQLKRLGFRTFSLMLETNSSLIEQRLLIRKNHFAKSGLLASQIATFEPLTRQEESTIKLNIDRTIEQLTRVAVESISITKEFNNA